MNLARNRRGVVTPVNSGSSAPRALPNRMVGEAHAIQQASRLKVCATSLLTGLLTPRSPVGENVKLFLYIGLFCAAALLIFFGTVSPCQIMRQEIRQGMALNKDSDSDLVSIFLTDEVIDNQITRNFGKYPTPVLCTEWLFGFLHPNAKVQTNGNQQQEKVSDALIEGARLCTKEFPTIPMECMFSLPPMK